MKVEANPDAAVVPWQRDRSVSASGSCLSSAQLAPLLWVCDDEVVNLRLADRLLQRLGMNVTAVTFGDGSDLPRDVPPNVTALLLDIVMKRSDGVDVCRMYRRAGYRLPIIAMTGNVNRCGP